MLDHVGATVSDLARSRAFYDAALGPLGIAVIMEVTPEQTGGGGHLGYGSNGRPYFWVGTGGAVTGRLHVALSAPNRKAVDAFHAAALAPAVGTTARSPTAHREAETAKAHRG